ncbi:MAG: hypothetical protein CR972_02780 [Candidatus Moraniibacteriota bacterium]|nr:MAG: hypothetical protein CR972_02780 [Candidatus Moranbacteria bacterium]
MSALTLFIKYLLDPSSAKGIVGEGIVKKTLIEQKNFYSFHDITISGQQIDHVLICTKGIFTIETKNYSGTIYGSYLKRDWSQVFQCMGKYNTYYKKNTFYNPVMQAENHSKALHFYLKKAFGISQYVKTLVVFTGSAHLKVFSPKTPVVYHKNLMNQISSMPSIMSVSECQSLARTLQIVANDIVNRNKTTFHYPIIVQST